VEDKDETDTTSSDLASVMQKSRLSVKNIPFNKVITSFSGLRAHENGGDFILGEAQDAPGFFNAAGIESPGLTSAPAIGVRIASQVAEKLNAAMKADFKAKRKGIVHLAELDFETRAEMIRENPLYGRIVCRCEQISEGEIVDAIHRPVGAVSLDGVMRRVRAGMGRCQAGFCTPRTMEILARELNRPMETICKNAPGSELLIGAMKGEEA
jgi:glycerol-3-phosphate dehydrogenase